MEATWSIIVAKPSSPNSSCSLSSNSSPSESYSFWSLKENEKLCSKTVVIDVTGALKDLVFRAQPEEGQHLFHHPDGIGVSGVVTDAICGTELIIAGAHVKLISKPFIQTHQETDVLIVGIAAGNIIITEKNAAVQTNVFKVLLIVQCQGAEQAEPV